MKWLRGKIFVFLYLEYMGLLLVSQLWLSTGPVEGRPVLGDPDFEFRTSTKSQVLMEKRGYLYASHGVVFFTTIIDLHSDREEDDGRARKGDQSPRDHPQ